MVYTHGYALFLWITMRIQKKPLGNAGGLTELGAWIWKALLGIGTL